MRLVTTVVVPQLHDPVMLAKALATGDMLSGGRLTVGLGVGGRREDYEAVGADPATQTMRGMAERVAVMKRIWAGEKMTDSVVPVGPAPMQKAGPQLLVGTMGPKTVRVRRRMGRRPGRHHAGPRHRQAERAVRRRADGVGPGRKAQAALWPPRSGSRSATATKRAHKCTGTCAAT